MKRIGWVVDVQNDFMLPPSEGGRLYVHDLNDPSDAGAIKIAPNLTKTVHWMRDHCDVIVYTGDWHGPEDAEISDTPDFLTTFPPHCMGRMDNGMRTGAFLHPSVNPNVQFGRGASFILPENATQEAGFSLGLLASEAIKAGLDKPTIFVRKTKFDVFEGNAGTAGLLQTLINEDTQIFVAGVASDVCVRFAIEGMAKQGYRNVIPVLDAMHGLGITPETDLIENWAHYVGGFASSQTLDLFLL